MADEKQESYNDSLIDASVSKDINILLLFDVDGTLSPSRLQADQNMWRTLQIAKQHPNIKFGIVGGSDFVKQQDQLGGQYAHAQFKGMNFKVNGANTRGFFNYVFSENGLDAFRNTNNEPVNIIKQDTLNKFFNVENKLFPVSEKLKQVTKQYKNDKNKLDNEIQKINKDLEPLFQEFNPLRDEIDRIFSKLKYDTNENKITKINDDGIAKEWSAKDTNKIVNWWMKAIADVHVEPMKTGTFVEYRTGMLNTCPVGRNCTQEQRMQFYNYDINIFPKLPHSNGLTLRETLVHRFYQYLDEPDQKNLQGKIKCSIGGQISIDVFPMGWDKRYCLQFVEKEAITFDEIHFFGDKTYFGGNDAEIYSDARTIGHFVRNPDYTRHYIREIIADLDKRNAQIRAGSKTKKDLVVAPSAQELTEKIEGAH